MQVSICMVTVFAMTTGKVKTVRPMEEAVIHFVTLHLGVEDHIIAIVNIA